METTGSVVVGEECAMEDGRESTARSRSSAASISFGAVRCINTTSCAPAFSMYTGKEVIEAWLPRLPRLGRAARTGRRIPAATAAVSSIHVRSGRCE